MKWGFPARILMDKFTRVKEALQNNLKNMYELTKPMFDGLRPEYLKEGLTDRQIAEAILDNVFELHNIDKDYNHGLYNACRALLCVEGLKLSDITLIMHSENDEVTSADYTFPDWVPDEYAGQSRMERNCQ